jgi:hypothetical protein
MLPKVLYVWFLKYGQQVQHLDLLTFESEEYRIAVNDLAVSIVRQYPQYIRDINDLAMATEQIKSFIQWYRR